jgi:hypothetical protein
MGEDLLRLPLESGLELFFLIDNLEKFALENRGRIGYQKKYGILRCTLDSFIQ